MAITGNPGFIGRGLPPTGLAALLARPGLRDALLATGSAMLQQADQPGSIGGALGRALPMGMQALQQGKQKAEYEQMLASAPPEMRTLLTMLGPERGIPALMQMMAPKPAPGPVTVGANERLVDPTTGKELLPAAPPEPEKPPAEVQTFREFLKMTPEEQARWAEFQRAKQAPGTTVNVAGPEGAASKAIGDAVAKTISGDDAAQSAVQKVGAIDRISQIVSNPKFKNVSGPLFGGTFGELSARFAEDPEARQLLAEFQAVGGQMTMAQLAAFTGPKTDFEFQQARRLAFNDTKMTPEEIRAGLAVYRRAAIADAQKWAKNLLDLDPNRLNFDPRNIAPQLDLAKQILDKYGEATGVQNDPLGIRRP